MTVTKASLTCYGTAQMQLDTRGRKNRGSFSIHPQLYVQVPVVIPVAVYTCGLSFTGTYVTLESRRVLDEGLVERPEINRVIS